MFVTVTVYSIVPPSCTDSADEVLATVYDCTSVVVMHSSSGVQSPPGPVGTTVLVSSPSPVFGSFTVTE